MPLSSVDKLCLSLTIIVRQKLWSLYALITSVINYIILMFTLPFSSSTSAYELNAINSYGEVCQKFSEGISLSIDEQLSSGVSEEYLVSSLSKKSDFKSLTWSREVIDLVGVNNQRISIQIKTAFVDIDNDGMTDFLIKKPVTTENGDSDNLYFYNAGSAKYLEDKTISFDFLNSTTSINWFSSLWEPEGFDPISFSTVEVVSFEMKNYLMIVEGGRHSFLAEFSDPMDWQDRKDALMHINLICDFR